MYGFLKNLRFFDPFIILFFRSAGLSFLQIGFLYSINEIIIQVTEIPSGMVADTIGRKRAMVFSFISYIISFAIFFSVNNYYLFMGAMVFFGFGEAFRSGTHKAMIMEYLKINKLTDYKVDYYGHTRSWAQAGSAISALIAAVLVFFSGDYKIVFIASIIPYVLDLILLASYPSELNYSCDEGNTCNDESILQSFKKVLSDSLIVMKKIKMINALTASSIMGAVFKTIKDYIQPVIKQFVLYLPIFVALADKERSAVLLGLVYFIIYVFSAISSRYSAALSKKFKSVYIAVDILLATGAIILTISGFLFKYELFLLVIICYLMFFMLQNFRKPMVVGYISDNSTPSTMATIHSVNAQFEALLKAILAPLLGFIVDAFGVGSGLTSMGIIMLIFLPISMISLFNRGK